MKELDYNPSDFFEKNKRFVRAYMTVFRAYESCVKDILVNDDLFGACISLFRFLWKRFVIFNTQMGIYKDVEEEKDFREISDRLHNIFISYIPRPRSPICNPKFEKSYKRKYQKAGDQGE